MTMAAAPLRQLSLANPHAGKSQNATIHLRRLPGIVIVTIIGLLLLSRNQAPCPIPVTTTTTTTTNNNEQSQKHSRYINPLSSRVPAEGIEAVLATSSTNPSFHFFAYSSKTDFVTAQIVRTGIYEKDSTTALINEIVCRKQPTTTNKPMLVLDLGANIGFHSLHMAACGARVISFEASPDTAWLLRSSAKLNGFDQDQPTPEKGNTLTLIPRGVSNVTSTARLTRHVKSPGMTSFVDVKQTTFEWQDGTQGSALDVDIPLVPARDVLKELRITSDRYDLRFLKVDVEGFEFQALQGLNLKQFPFEYLTLEFFPSLLKAGGTDPSELLVYIWNQGYRYLDFDSKKKLSDYEKTNTGATESEVRTWAKNLTQKGYNREKDGFHINLLAQKVR